MKDTVLLGDSLTLLAEIPSESIAACITDPPYNYEFVGRDWNHAEIQRRQSRVTDSKTLVKHVPYGSGLAGGVRNAAWYKKNRENIEMYERWVQQWGREVYRISKPGAYIAVFNSTRTVAQVQVALERVGFYARDILVYRKPSGIPKGFNLESKLEKLGDERAETWTGWHSALRNEWEAIALLQKPLRNNYLETFEKYGVGLMKTEGDAEGFQSNILEGLYERANRKENPHPTVKSLPLMRRLVQMLVPPVDGNVVLDPFAGSGSTLVAAAQLGVNYLGMEIEEEYFEIIQRRLGEITVSSDVEHHGTLF